jgi:hypothetical protein
MRLVPDAESRAAIKFWLGCLQAVTVIVGVVSAYFTFAAYTSQQEQYIIEQKSRAQAQEQRAKEQLEATIRELERPYQEKKLALYLEAARVLAHLASRSDVNKEQTEARFWELYWGELAFVESTTAGESQQENRPSVERLMVEFCHEYFPPGECAPADDTSDASGAEKTRTSSIEKAAINMARQASKEIRDRWERLGEGVIAQGRDSVAGK